MQTEDMTNKNYTFKKCDNNYIVSVANRSDLADTIMEFCNDLNIKAGSITGIGAVDEATLRFYDPSKKQYVDTSFWEQMEIANLTGNISEMNERTYIHLHCVLGRADYTALAGHLLSCRINGACEIVITTYDIAVDRYHDNETGLNMYRF